MNRNLSVGLVITAAGALLLLAVFLLGQDQALFKSRNSYTLLLPNVVGLDIGSPVKLAGVQVGVVTAIRLPRSLEEQSIQVTLGVSRDVADRIRADTEAKMRSLSLLAGDKYVELSMGSLAQPVVEPGGAIVARLSDFELLTDQGTAVADDLTQITRTLRLIFARIEQKEGVLGRLLMDPEFGSESLADVGSVLTSLRRITADLEGGRGLLGAALNDPVLRDRVFGELTGVLGRMNRVLDALGDPATPLGSLLSAEGVTSDTLADLRGAAAAVRDLTRRIEDGDGLLPRLLDDGEYADRVLGDLEITLRNLASITGKIDRGEGTVGALVNDPAVYQGLRDVVTGVQESRMLRWLINRYARRGEKARAEAPIG